MDSASNRFLASPGGRPPWLSLAYQPIVSFSDGSIQALEALTRVRIPLVGSVSPRRFIGCAEGARLSFFHTSWVVGEAASRIAAWQSSQRPLLVSVNVSARDLGKKRFVAMITETLRKSGLYPPNLQLEITETSLFQSDSAISAQLAELRDIGVRIAIDDFGTGFSTLKSMLDVSADAVKLDCCFVRGLETSSKRRAVILAAIELAHSLGMEVIAEGVETKQQRRFLQAAGCDAMQGYLVGPPLSLEKLSSMMDCRMRRSVRARNSIFTPHGLAPQVASA